jgi:peptidoglycan hydrolase-like protein with peptidoglycan-binding domain
MMGRRRISLVVSGLSVGAVIALPAVASGQDVTIPTTTSTTPDQTTPATGATGLAGAGTPAPTKDGRKPAHMSVVVHGVHKDGKVRVGKPARAFGYLRPFVPGEHVRVKLVDGGKVLRNVNPEVNKVQGKNKGRFNFHSKDLVAPGAYKVIAEHERTGNQRRVVARSKKFGISYPDLDPGNRSSVVKTFNNLLNRRGYFSSGGKTYNVRTQWAVMAFRKVNGMSRNYNANPKIFRKLAANKGKFHLQHPGAGKHVEVDISKQVMALAKDGKAQHVFAVSTGAPATPTIRGHFHFYRKDPGYNSEGMYYSVYFIRGYATHGYDPDPPYNASHGCVRNPIPDSIFIYNWISLGDSIYVYG